jgi:dienelactone hydrolase
MEDLSMTTRTFDDLQDETMRLYQQGDYAATLDLLTREGDQYPDEGSWVLYMRACMAARVGQPAETVRLLDEALDRGYWFGEPVMRQSPSFLPLQGQPDFERVAALNIARAAEAHAEPVLLVREPDGGCAGAPCPAVLALHGNGADGPSALRGWEPLVDRGWLLAALQSSQIAGQNQFVWDDQAVALREAADHYAALQAQYTLDPARTLVAGFSMGGETALRLALSRTIPVRGFILLGPGGPTIDTPNAWLPLITQHGADGLRGAVILGEADTGVPHDAIRAIVALLNEHGIPCLLETVPGVRHAYPPDFGPILDRALAFVLNSNALPG